MNWLIWSAFLWEGIAVFFLCARGFKSVLILELFCTFRMNYLDFRRWLKVFELLQRWLWVLLLSKELGRRNFYILYFSLQLFRPDLLLLFQLVLLISLLLLPVVLLVYLEQRIWLRLQVIRLIGWFLLRILMLFLRCLLIVKDTVGPLHIHRALYKFDITFIVLLFGEARIWRNRPKFAKWLQNKLYLFLAQRTLHSSWVIVELKCPRRAALSSFWELVVIDTESRAGLEQRWHLLLSWQLSFFGTPLRKRLQNRFRPAFTCRADLLPFWRLAVLWVWRLLPGRLDLNDSVLRITKGGRPLLEEVSDSLPVIFCESGPFQSLS